MVEHRWRSFSNDESVGETLESGRLGAKLVFGFSFVLIALAGVWVW